MVGGVSAQSQDELMKRRLRLPRAVRVDSKREVISKRKTNGAATSLDFRFSLAELS
jgi:hypothetical protein